MIYGANLLTSVPVDWVLDNATMSQESLSIQPGGSATQTIELGVLGTMPASVMVQIVALSYTNQYDPNMFVDIQAISEDDKVYTYTIPIVDTDNGVCAVELPTEQIKHKSLTFTIRSEVAVSITEWFFAGPMATEVDLTEVFDRIPRLLKDYNTDPITVGEIEETIIMISAYATENTELTGLLVVSYLATEATLLTIRIYDNNIEELYTPLTFNIAAGYGTVSVPHAYLNLLKGYHTFTVTAQVESGSITMDTRKILYVIDGGRLMDSLADIGSRATDMTIRRVATDFDISFIYAVCVDDETGLVKKAAYITTPGAAWMTEASLGPAIDAAIEFDGVWVVNQDLHDFHSEDHPWVAWVTPDNVLCAKNLSDDATYIELATNVLKVAMIKGWGVLPGQDQGVVVGYLKADGKIYYRSWCTQISGNKDWDYERQLVVYTGTAVDLNLFRTNDFRIGFNILDVDGKTYSYVTKRNYSSMSGINETARFDIGNISYSLAISEITYHAGYVNEIAKPQVYQIMPLMHARDYTEAAPNLLPIAYGQIISPHVFLLSFNYPVFINVDWQLRDAIKDYTVTHLEVSNDTMYITTEEPIVKSFNVTLPPGTLYFRSGNYSKFNGSMSIAVSDVPINRYYETVIFDIESVYIQLDIAEIQYQSTAFSDVVSFELISVVYTLNVRETEDEILPV